MADHDPGRYWWEGVERARRVGLTGWIGETPEGWVPFLLLYPTAHGIAHQMRELADVLELPPAEDAPTAVHQASATIDVERLTLRFPGFETAIVVNADFANSAVERGWGILTLGLDAWDGHHGPRLERYLARTRRLHYGRIVISAG